MCVIMLAQRVRPTEEMIDKAWDYNKDGAGFAWRQGNEVHFEKGIMEVGRVKELCAELPMPYVVHFRVASVGGVKQTLTHPFIVSKDAPLPLVGKTKGGVLFHNGHWGDWNAKALEAAIHSNTRIPTGDWSDTRAIAWMISIYGAGFMEFLPTQRGVYFTAKDMDVFTGPGWIRVNDVWCSNDIFWTKKHYNSGNSNYSSYGRVCHVGRCTNKALAGKTVCEDCEKKQSPNTVAALPATTQTTQESTGTIGGAGNTAAPFAPAGTFLSMKEAEARHRAGDMSKGMLKRFRKHHDQFNSKSPKAVAKAQTLLMELSHLANKKLYKSGSKA
jgi:hypothetical protein